MNFWREDFENKESKDVLLALVDKISNYDIYDFISRVAGLNLMSENQNKSVLLDTLIQYILEREESKYVSTSKMSAGKFRTIINELNSTHLCNSIDPCENVFIQNVMLGANYRVFNGIDETPAYNLQMLIRVLFLYRNDFDERYLKKVYKLFTFILGISEEIVRTLNLSIDKIKYDEQRMVILPSGEEIKRFANLVVLPIHKVERFVDGYFQIDDMASGFGNGEIGDLDNRPFYQKPFLINSMDKTVIILNVSLLSTFAFYKAAEWANEYGIKEDVIRKFNDYAWLETIKTLGRLGHKKINERALGLECISKDYYKEIIVNVYNDCLMTVIFMCDDGYMYPEEGIHVPYPDKRHNKLLQKRLKYYGREIKRLKIPKEDWYVLFITNSYGRGMGIQSNYLPFGYRPIRLNTFELHCVSIKERNTDAFLPRYIRAKNQINTMMPDIFSELNNICIYSKNQYTFYMSDEMDPDEMNILIASGDSIDYISEALVEENRILIDSYIEGEKSEVILIDKVRKIYIEDNLFKSKNMAFCVLFNNIKIWIKTEDIEDYEHMGFYSSLVDAISYWLAECAPIIEQFDLIYCVYVLNISLSGEIMEYYCQRTTTIPYEECVDKVISKNHIFLEWKPEAFTNLDQITNQQEKELCRFLLDIFNEIAYQPVDYSNVLERIFSNPLKKKFFSFTYESKPYFEPIEIENNRKIHPEDEDYLAGLVGKELLQTGSWKIGLVPNERKNEVSHVVIDWLYARLQIMVSAFAPENMLEVIYYDLEETLYKLLISESRFYSEITCYPEKEDLYIEEFNCLNKTSMALKFLIEYVTAKPAVGKKHFGIGQYEELLAICSMIIEWAYKGDLFTYGIVNTPIEFLKSKRIGLKKEKFVDMYHYGDVYRRRQLRYNSSSITRKHYDINMNDYFDELEVAYEKEYGYKYSEFAQVIIAMVALNDTEIACITEESMPSKLVVLNKSLRENIIKKVIEDITYRPRQDYLVLPSKYKAWEAYPWRFNRRYSFNRRPVLQRGDKLLWGNRQLYHMLEYVTELIYLGKLSADSPEMVELMGRISKDRGRMFNNLIFNMIQDMNEFDVIPNVKKVNGVKLSNLEGNDLGDIDILIIDKKSNKVIAAEVKAFRFSRNPYEIRQEYIKMFVDNGKKVCFATKHKRRMEWLKEHIDDLKVEYGLDDREWIVDGVFIVSEPLISSELYNKKIKCISTAELSAEKIREI